MKERGRPLAKETRDPFWQSIKKQLIRDLMANCKVVASEERIIESQKPRIKCLSCGFLFAGTKENRICNTCKKSQRKLA